LKSISSSGTSSSTLETSLMDIHIVAVAVVFASSVLGSYGSILLSTLDGFHASTLKSVINMFSAGVIASLAIVHISSEVIIELNAYIVFPLGACCILFGILSMSIFEHVSHSWVSSKTFSQGDVEIPLCDNVSIDCANCHQHCNQAPTEHDEITVMDHTHTCVVNLGSKSLSCVATTEKSTKRKVIVLYLFEFACVFHSFIIGLSLGLIDDIKSAKTMMIALCFHQFLEGVSLGFVVKEANISIIRSIVFVASFSVTTPIGITLGTWMNKLFSPMSKDERIKVIATSCFQGVAGGMLLYIALFQLIAEEFSKEELHKSGNVVKKIALYVSLLLGGTSMCILALWI
jgi:zinc transporter 1/2/3